MNKQILDYLDQNKGRHERADLEAALLKAGYKPLEIEEAVEKAYGLREDAASPGAAGSAAAFDFWDFRARVAYASTEQRRKDFWFGLGAPFLLNLALTAASRIILLSGRNDGLSETLSSVVALVRTVLGLVFFAAIFYLWNRRRSISYGIIAGYILSVVIAGALLVFIFALAAASF